MAFKAVIFDLDGTLLDTLEDLANSMNSVLKRHGFPVHEADAYRYLVGDGITMLVTRALPEQNRDEETVFQCREEMIEQYDKHWADNTRPYEGVAEMLTALGSRGIPMTILSNKPDRFTKPTVEKLLSEYRFEIIFGARDSVPIKPDPAGALEIADTLHIPPEEFLYLGDTGTDIKTAISAGMYPVGVLWGFRPREELAEAGAERLIEKPEELLELLE